MSARILSAFFPTEGIWKVPERSWKEFGRFRKERGRLAPGLRPVSSFFGPFPSALKGKEKK